MKKLSILFLTLFFIGCAKAELVIENDVPESIVNTPEEIQSMSINEKLEQLNLEYQKIKLSIVFDCDHDGKWVQRIAQLRDNGKSFRWASEANIRTLENAINEGPILQSQITTELALRQVLTVIWIYSNYKSSPEELYSLMFEDCTTEAFAKLDYDFNLAKQILIQQKIEMWGSEPGTDFEDPTATEPNDPHYHK